MQIDDAEAQKTGLFDTQIGGGYPTSAGFTRFPSILWKSWKFNISKSLENCSGPPSAAGNLLRAASGGLEIWAFLRLRCFGNLSQAKFLSGAYGAKSPEMPRFFFEPLVNK